MAENFRVTLVIEQNRVAAETYRANLGDHLQVGDITKLEPAGTCDVLVAGPLCQGFSTLGKQDKSDPRNKLSLLVGAWAGALLPKIVVVENVPTFLESQYWSKLKKEVRVARVRDFDRRPERC